jgi:hypothetical protein
MTYSYNSLQFTLLLARNVLALVGVALLATGAYRWRTAQRPREKASSRGRMIGGAASSLVALLAGVVLWLVGPSTQAQSGLYEVSSTHFRSEEMPALELRAPVGWELSFDNAKAQIQAAHRGENGAIEAALHVESFTSDASTSEELASQTKAGFEKQLTATCEIPPDAIVVGGKSGRALDCKLASGSTRLLLVQRGRGFFTPLQCTGPDAKTACAEVIQAVSWLRPSNPQVRALLSD